MDKQSLTRQRIVVAVFLEDLRKGKGIGRLELAQRLEVEEEVIAGWESGKRAIDLVELRAFCQAIDMPLVECLQFLEKTLVLD